MAVAFTLAHLKETVLTDLGFGGVDLEILDAHVKRAIDAAYKMVARSFPQRGNIVIPITKLTQKYVLTPPRLLGVLGVEFFNNGGRLEEAPYYTRWVDRMIELGDMEDTQRWFGDSPEWTFQSEIDGVGAQVNYLYCYFTSSSFVDTFARIPNYAAVEFSWAIEASEDIAVGTTRTPLDLQQWVEDYAVARARCMLGDIRGKFGGIPGPNGDNILPIDAERQVANGREDQRRLETDLMDRRRQLPMIID